MSSSRMAELTQILRVARRVIAQEVPIPPALALITRTLKRDGENLTFRGAPR